MDGHTLQTDDTPHDRIDFPHVHIRILLADRVFRLESRQPDRHGEINECPES